MRSGPLWTSWSPPTTLRPCTTILLARAIILGAGQFRSKGQPGLGMAASRPREIEDEARPYAQDGGAEKGQDREWLSDKSRREAAELAAPLPAFR